MYGYYYFKKDTCVIILLKIHIQVFHQVKWSSVSLQIQSFTLSIL